MIPADPIVSASQNQVSGSLNGETVLLSSTTNQYYGLNTVGSRIWELIQQPRRLSAICNVLAEEFQVDPSICERDTRELVGKLGEAELAKLQY